jgi:hypothetical protein
MSPSPSFKKYLQQHADDFRVVSFYEKYDFESRAMAETALCQTVKSVISKGTKSRKLTLLCTLLSGNSYEVFTYLSLLIDNR